MNFVNPLRITIVSVLFLGFSTPQLVRAQDATPIGVNSGEMYPDFLLPTLDGEPGRFSDYRGKKILLFHFASW